jgi:hypothetical protein
LLAVARDTSAPYDLRVQAARALTPLISQSVELGSKELSFIAHPSTPAAARQPYFAEARIAAAAAASTSPSDRDLLLREAIAINPDGPDADHARIDLLLLQQATADPSATLAILRPVQSSQNMYSFSANRNDTESDADTAMRQVPDEPDTATRGAAIDSPDNVTAPPVFLPPAVYKLDLPVRIRLATQMASANQRDGNLESALAYAELAVSLAKESPQPELMHRRDDLKTAVLLARRNSLRRPLLRAQLDQSNQVRPHLTASTVYQEESQ